MAFTSIQKFTMMGYLGYPCRNFTYSDAVENAFLAVGDGGVLQSLAEAMAEKIASVDGYMFELIDAIGLKSVDKGDVVWQDSNKLQHPALAGVQSMGKLYIARLARLLDLPIAGDYFGTMGPQGTLVSTIKRQLPSSGDPTCF